jgi:lysophospholipase L1-like esterase
VALAALSLLLFAGVAELAARSCDLRPAAGDAGANPPWLGQRWLLRPVYREELARAGLLSRYYDLYEWDRYLFYRLRPHVDVELLDVFAPPAARERTRWNVRTNSRGFRTPEFDVAPAPGRVRVVALGDSSTFGWGVERSEAWPARLAASLAMRWHVDPGAIEVINLGVPGYSTFQGRILLERVAFDLHPHLLVWSFLSNDGTATGAPDLASYQARLGGAGALLAALHRSRAFETLEAWIARARRALAPAEPPDARDPEQRNVPSYAAAAANVRAAIADARSGGVPLVLLGQCVRGAPAALLARVAARTDTPYLDGTALLDASIPQLAQDPGLRARLRARYGAGALREEPHLWAFLPDGCHPNAPGHGLVADALAETIATAWPRPPGPATPPP